MSSSAAERIHRMHEGSIEQLIESHKRRTEEPLVLAIRYELEHPDDVFLLEVLDGFPGGDDDELLTTEFGPSPSLLVLGTLHLSLGSPAQVLSAVQRSDALIDEVRRGKLLWSDGSPTATRLRLAIFGQADVAR